jgi:phosphate transport system protein
MPRKSLDHELQLIRDELLLLSSMVETALIGSVTVLRDHDMEGSRIVYDNDAQINTKRIELEGQIIVTIATEAPVTTDLRFLASAMSICTELERIGDYAKTIARINLISEGISIPRLLTITYDMGVKAADMLHIAMTAFIQSNSPLAVRIMADDDVVDGMYRHVYAELMNFVIRDVENADRANYLFWVAHNLERAADRVTNICERTVYVETGELDHGSFSRINLP